MQEGAAWTKLHRVDFQAPEKRSHNGLEMPVAAKMLSDREQSRENGTWFRDKKPRMMRDNDPAAWSAG